MVTLPFPVLPAILATEIKRKVKQVVIFRIGLPADFHRNQLGLNSSTGMAERLAVRRR
jgi:hypothetical protein